MQEFDFVKLAFASYPYAQIKKLIKYNVPSLLLYQETINKFSQSLINLINFLNKNIESDHHSCYFIIYL